MVLLNFASQARFECLILHFVVSSSIYKCWNVISRTQYKMAARNDQENFLANILEAHVLSNDRAFTS